MTIDFIVKHGKELLPMLVLAITYLIVERMKIKNGGDTTLKKISMQIENLSKKVEEIILDNSLRVALSEVASETMCYATSRKQREFIEVKTQNICEFMEGLTKQSIHKLTVKDVDNLLEIHIANSSNIFDDCC